MAGIIELKDKSLPDDCYVYKHSTACGISQMASQEIKAGVFPLPLYWVNVLEQRDLSNWIAESYSTAHQSPQLLLIKNGAVEQVWSHFNIKREKILGAEE